MLRHAPRIFIMIMVVSLLSCERQETLDDYAGRWAKYVLIQKPPIPGLTHLVVALPSIETVDGVPCIWYQMEVFSGEKRMFAIEMLTPSLDFLYRCADAVPVERYIFYPPEGGPVEWKHQTTGDCIIPKVDFFQNAAAPCCG